VYAIIRNINRPVPERVVKKFNLESTLRELSLKAIVKQKTRNIPSDLEELKNLRKKLFWTFLYWRDWSKKIKALICILITAITLKNDLLKTASEPFIERGFLSNEDCASKELCCFLASLMHSEITTLRLPMLSINPVPENRFLNLLLQNGQICLSNDASLSFMDNQEADFGVQTLIAAIDAKCSTLKTIRIIPFSGPEMQIIKDSLFDSPAFFRVLSRLTSLDLDCYDCGDWALEQIGTHATDLV
jgi:hypothetical protein